MKFTLPIIIVVVTAVLIGFGITGAGTNTQRGGN